MDEKPGRTFVMHMVDGATLRIWTEQRPHWRCECSVHGELSAGDIGELMALASDHAFHVHQDQ